MLGETEDGRLFHIELQSHNDPEMVWRMLDYACSIRRAMGQWPDQIVLYVGNSPMRMGGKAAENGLVYSCRMIDARNLDGERLLESDALADNLMALLTDARGESLDELLRRIGTVPAHRRRDALRLLEILGKLRDLGDRIRGEIKKMPVLEEDFDTEYDYRSAQAELLTRLMRKRFGQVPASLKARLTALTVPEIGDIGERLLDARSLEELLPPQIRQ